MIDRDERHVHGIVGELLADTRRQDRSFVLLAGDLLFCRAGDSLVVLAGKSDPFIVSAPQRKGSQGGHFSTNFTESLPQASKASRPVHCDVRGSRFGLIHLRHNRLDQQRTDL
jgi:hypothetical protein